MGVGGARRMRIDARRRNAGLERRAHVGLVGGEKEVGGERLQVAPGRAAAREHAALHRHAVGLRRAEHAHPGDRIVARQDHDLDPLRRRVVEGEQLLHQRERDARAWPPSPAARAAAPCRRGRRWLRSARSLPRSRTARATRSRRRVDQREKQTSPDLTSRPAERMPRHANVKPSKAKADDPVFLKTLTSVKNDAARRGGQMSRIAAGPHRPSRSLDKSFRRSARPRACGGIDNQRRYAP